MVDPALGQPFVTLLLSGLPPGIHDELIREMFGAYAPVLATKIVDPKPGQPSMTALIGVPQGMAQGVVEAVNGSIPQGLTAPIICRVVPEHGGFHLMLIQAAKAALANKGKEKAQAGWATSWSKTGDSGWEDWKDQKKDNLYVKNLPDECTEEMLMEVFGKHATVTSARVLPRTANKPGATGFVRVSSNQEAKYLVDEISGTTPEGWQWPVQIKFAGEEARQDGDWDCEQCGHTNFRRRAQCNKCGQPRPDHLGPIPFWEKDQAAQNVNLYLQGLPLHFKEADIKALFGQYGNIAHTKILPVASGKDTAAGFCCMEEAGAKWCVNNIHGYVPPGFAVPIQVSVADESKRRAEKGAGRAAPY